MKNPTVEKIRLFMIKKDLRQYQAASILGINKYTLNRWLKGQSKPSIAYERLVDKITRESI